MLLRTLAFIAVLACGVLALRQATADDKTKDKPALSGTWMKKGGEMKIEFADKDVLKISPHGKDELILIACKYTVDAKGIVQAKISELEGSAKDKVKEILPVGLAFSFKWQVKDDSATLEDVKGDNVEMLRAHLEGDFAKK